MHLVDNQGNTKYDTLTKFSQRTGKQHPDLIQPYINEDVLYIWHWFMELNQQRTSNGFGQNPIQFIDIKAWSDLTNRHIKSWEVMAIRMLDSIWLMEMNKIIDSQKPVTKIK